MSVLHSGMIIESNSRQKQNYQNLQRQESSQHYLANCCSLSINKLRSRGLTKSNIDIIGASSSKNNRKIIGVQHYAQTQNTQRQKCHQFYQQDQSIHFTSRSTPDLTTGGGQKFNKCTSPGKNTKMLISHYGKTSVLSSECEHKTSKNRLSIGKYITMPYNHCNYSLYPKTIFCMDAVVDGKVEQNDSNSKNNSDKFSKNTKDCFKLTNASTATHDRLNRRLHYRFSRSAILTTTYNIFQSGKNKRKPSPAESNKTAISETVAIPNESIRAAILRSSETIASMLQQDNSDSGIILDRDVLSDSEHCISSSGINNSIVISEISSESDSSAICTPSPSTVSSPLSTPSRFKPQLRYNDLSDKNNFYLHQYLHHHQQHISHEIKIHNPQVQNVADDVNSENNNFRLSSPVAAMHSLESVPSSRCRQSIVTASAVLSPRSSNATINSSCHKIAPVTMTQMGERIQPSSSMSRNDVSQSAILPGRTISMSMPSISAAPSLPSSITSSIKPVTGDSVRFSQKNTEKFNPRYGPSSYRQLLPIVLCILSFATVFSILIVYMDTTEIRHQQFRINMSRDYEMFGVAQDDPQLIAFVREIHMPKYSLHFLKGHSMGSIADSINEQRLLPSSVLNSGFGKERMTTSAPIHFNLSNSYPQEMTSKMAYYVASLLKEKTNGAVIQSITGSLGQLLVAPWLTETLNWAGLVIEPEPRRYFTLRKQNALLPRLQVVHACVSPNPYPKEVTIPNKESDVQINSLLDEETSWFNSRVKCFPLYSIMLAANRVEYDLLSLGVHGHELQILQTMPFENVNIEIISIHLDDELDNLDNYVGKITKFLQSKTYKLQKRFGHNYFYQRFNYNKEAQQIRASTPSVLSLLPTSTVALSTTGTILKKQYTDDLGDKSTRK